MDGIESEVVKSTETSAVYNWSAEDIGNGIHQSYDRHSGKDQLPPVSALDISSLSILRFLNLRRIFSKDERFVTPTITNGGPLKTTGKSKTYAKKE